MRKYIDSLIENINNRFSDCILDVLRSFDIFNPLSVPEREEVGFSHYGEDKIKILIEHFYREKPVTEKQEIEAEWKKIKYHFVLWKKEFMLTDKESEQEASTFKLSPTQRVLQRILQRRKDFEIFFPNIVFLAEICQSTPVSNAWPERGASVVKRLKTRFRSQIKEDMLMCLMHISINGHLQEQETTIVDAIKKWRNDKQRRKLPKAPANSKTVENTVEVEAVECENAAIQTDITGDIISHETIRSELRSVAKSFLLEMNGDEEFDTDT